jgi:undecaprenyl-diphosphatase
VSSVSRRRLDTHPLLTDHPTAFKTSLVLWAIGGFTFVALTVAPLKRGLQAIDDWAWQVAIDLQTPVLVWIGKAMDVIGSTLVVAPIMIGVAIYLIFRKRWEGLGFWILAMLTSQLLIGPVKTLYGRPRPPLPLVETTGFSFPSGHSVAGAAVAISLVIVLVPAGPKRRNLEILAGLFAFVMALTRVYLRAHWLSDTAGGAALGAAVAVGAAAFVHWYVDRRSRGTADAQE